MSHVDLVRPPDHPDWRKRPDQLGVPPCTERGTQFIYLASILALHYVEMLDEAQPEATEDVKVIQKILRNISTDIQNEIREQLSERYPPSVDETAQETPSKDDGLHPFAGCSTCLPTFYKCTLPAPTCQNNYQTCVRTCTYP